MMLSKGFWNVYRHRCCCCLEAFFSILCQNASTSITVRTYVSVV